MRLVALVGAVAILAACGESTSPATPGDLALQRALWEQHAIASYDFDFTHSSEWFSARTDRVSVRNGVVTKIVNLATGDSIGPHPDHRDWPTVDAIYDQAASALEDAETEEGTYEVRFDPNLNFIRRLAVDRFQWADDSFSYEIRNFVRR